VNVLSLFDGLSGAQIALNRAGIKYEKYFASEIDKYAIKVTQANYPETIQLGDIKKVNIFNVPDIDLLVGGSPCQGFSFAGKQLNFEDERSKLFFEFVRLLKELDPKYFILENVKMKKEYQDIISKLVGVEPIEINSALVSAQNRKRLYWTNIPGIKQPEDKNILLKDILEDNLNNIGRIVGRRISLITGKRDDYNKNIKPEQRIEPRFDNKCGCLTTVQKDNVVIFDISSFSPVFKKNYVQYDIKNKGHNSQDQRAFFPKNKHGCLPSQGASSKVKVYLGCIREKSKCVRSGGRGSYDRHEWYPVDKNHCRKLTVLECERLQTIPDNYTIHVSNSQRYKMIGNGFTIDVIAHILKGIK
jgi:DNA (cytosine-5)-methyltransferase 3A